VILAAVLLLPTRALVADDAPEEARQKALTKAQDALIAAAKQGEVGQVRAQLQAGADVNARDSAQRTALLLAVRNGQRAVVRALIDAGAGLDARDQDGRTPLMEAARRKEAIFTLDLVAAGADVNVVDNDGWTALMFAVREGTLAAARAIIRSPKQSTLDTLTKETSALTLAAERGRLALVRALIEAGAGVRKPEIGGRALQLAAQEEHVDVVRTLMEAKAPLGYSVWDNEPPLQAAAARGQWLVVEGLLEAGLEPDQLDRGGQTALMKAAAGGHDKVVASLLRLGASPDLADREGWTALMHAAAHPSSGSVPAIRDLVRAGAGVNRRAGPSGKTPLMIAAEKGNELATDELLRSGAQADLKSGGKTALDFALAEGNKRCAERLGYVERR
jgi:serine/threonine-protein phosphatase 6 regulatory ankyrin repeat subunit B